jgi:glycosyltransferase involved in cell wall biosynthesis
MKVLINTPNIDLHGGVSNHYKGLRIFWNINVYYNYIGSRKHIPGFLIFPFDFVKFFFICLFKKMDLVVLNPSLNKKAITRESIYFKTAVLLKKKVIIFWHGWSPEMVELIDANPNWFVKKFKRSLSHIVLSNSFKIDLIRWGVESPIYLSTTKVDDRILKGFHYSQKQVSDFTILFLSRIEIYKGIYITLNAYKELVKKYENIHLLIVGEGSQLKNAKDFAIKNSLKNIYFTGNLTGEALVNAFKKSSIYVLPTYNEGMPTSVLEAMAFGLPIITRPVGGINDFFKDGEMGYLIDSLDPHEFTEKISFLFENGNIINKMGGYNYEYASSYFLASKVVLQLESIFKDSLLQE